MRRLALVLAIGTGSGLGTSRPPIDPASCLVSMREVNRWTLSQEWREASGLAAAGDDRVWLHGDEVADLTLLSTVTGNPLARTRFGKHPPRDDFEGSTMLGQVLYLVTSTGDLYRAALPATGPIPAWLPFQRSHTDVGRECEIEGLTTDATPGVLLLACKTPYRKSLAGTVTLFRWDVNAGARARPDRLTVPSSDLGERQFRTSDVARDAVTNQLLLLSSIDNRFAILAADGHALGSRRLGRRHPQPEGIAWLGAGRLAISDEGGSGRATLTVYQCGP
jgi:hypothetical protein